MRIKQVPVAALFDLLHEQVRNAHAGEQIMRPQPFVAVVEPRIEKRKNVFMPYIQIDGNGPFALPQLIDAHRCIVQLLHPRDDAGGNPFKPFDVAAARTDFA